MTDKAQKIVAGMGRGQMTERSMQRAIETNLRPDYVDSWLTWFDKKPCDNLRDKGGSVCSGCRDTDKCEGVECHSKP